MKTYEDGLNDAWELAREVISSPNNENKSFTWVSENVIGSNVALFDIIRNYSASEIIEEIKKYEEIKVGDEIERINGNHDRKYIVTKIIESDYINIMFDDGGVGYVNPIHYRKTGRHYPQIEEILKQMQMEKINLNG